MSESTTRDLLGLTAKIVSAHIGSNKVATDALPSLIQSVYGCLSTVDQPDAASETPAPAVSWKKSVFADFIICLEDGAKVKLLKPYLRKRYSLTPEAYRSRWGLPANYPMVALGYSRRRSTLAREFGLGRKAAPAVGESEPVQEEEAEAVTVTQVKARRARGSKG